MTHTAIDPRVSDRHDTMSSVPALRTTDLIGRDAELEQLTAQLGIRTSGDPSGPGAGDPHTAPARAVLVGGDAGVGKSSLVRAVTASVAVTIAATRSCHGELRAFGTARSTPARRATSTKCTRTASKREANRRNQPRTVDSGTPSSSPIGR